MNPGSTAIPLNTLLPGDAGTIVGVRGEGAFRRRLLDMGFVEGERVRVIKTAPLTDPIEFCVGGTHVTLRKAEAALVMVTPLHHHGRGHGPGCGMGHGRGRRRRWLRWGRSGRNE